MMITATEAQKLTKETLEKREKAAQTKADNWVATECPGYVYEATSEGRDRTREFKCPKEIYQRAAKTLETLGYTVKYREDAELIKLFW